MQDTWLLRVTSSSILSMTKFLKYKVTKNIDFQSRLVFLNFPNAAIPYSASWCTDPQTIDLLLLLLHNYNFTIVMNHNINIWVFFDGLR